MINMLNSIGVLLAIGGFTCFFIGVFRFVVPQLENLITKEFQKIFTLQFGAILFLIGLVLLYI